MQSLPANPPRPSWPTAYGSLQREGQDLVRLGEGAPQLAGLAVELARSAGDGQRGRLRLARPEMDGALNCQAAAPDRHRDDAVRARLLRVLFRCPGHRSEALVAAGDRVAVPGTGRSGDLIIEDQLVALRELGRI